MSDWTRQRWSRLGRAGYHVARFRLVLTGVVLVALTACQGVVVDPVGDGYGLVDIVDAGVNYGKVDTRLWLRYSSESLNNGSIRWNVSTDGDTTREFYVILYGYQDDDPNEYAVYRLGTASTSCSGQVPNHGYVTPHLVELKFDLLASVCRISSPPTVVRISASSYLQEFGEDFTDWTGVVPIS